MKKYLLSILFFLLIIQIKSQDYQQYYKRIASAYEYYAKENYEKTTQICNEAFEKQYPFPDDIDLLKKAYLAIGDKENAYQAMRKMVLCGFKLEEQLPIICPENSILSQRYNDTRSGDSLLEARLKEEYPRLREEYLKNVDFELNKYIEVLACFETYGELIRVKSSSLSDKKFILVQDIAFEVKKELFMNLMKEKPELPRYKIDAWTSSFTDMMIIHTAQSTNKDDFQAYFDLLLEQVKKGNIHPVMYAVCYDNVYAFHLKNKKSVYGQQAAFTKKGTNQCIPVENVKEVDKRRAEIGLPPLWVWCKIYNIEPPEGYTVP